MSRDNLQAKGNVIELLSDGVCRVELPNGHRCIARASGDHRLNFIRLANGDTVDLEFHPYDLSRDRIIVST